MCAEIHRLAFKIGKRTPYEIQTNKTSKTKKGRYFARQPLNINFTDSNILNSKMIISVKLGVSMNKGLHGCSDFSYQAIK